MSSISTDSKGRRILYVNIGGTRRKIALGDLPKKAALRVQRHIDHLVVAKLAGVAIEPDTARWLGEIAPTLHARLVELGLTAARDSAALAAFVDSLIAGRSDVKESTKITWRNARRCLVQYFGAEKPLRSITPGDCDQFVLWMAQKANVRDKKRTALATNTVRRRTGICKEIFKTAVRRRLIDANPFADLRSATLGNADRLHFVTAADTEKLLAAAPDADWRCIIALCRYGAMRCPSEVLTLRWGDIDWHPTEGKLVVTVPKLEHIPGKGVRTVPLFDDLRAVLAESREIAPEGTLYVVNRYRDKRQNLRTQFTKIIRRAGLEPWPNLFKNLRGSRETELLERFTLKNVADWVGHSTAVALRHYVMTTQEAFREAVQFRVQSGAVQTLLGATNEPPSDQESGSSHTHSQGSTIVNKGPVGVTGLEAIPVTTLPDSNLRRKQKSQGAKTGAIQGADALLDELLTLWPRLSAAQRRALVRMAEGSAK